MTYLQIEDLEIAYGKNTILRDVTLSCFKPGTITGILGPNGVGKSSFLRTLAGLAPYRGSIQYDETENRTLGHGERARKVSYLPQTLPQGTNLVAYESVISACRAVRPDLPRHIVETMTEAVFDRLNIRHLAFQPMNSMSGGQRQMIGLAQIIVRKPDVMLLDEPTSALDLRWQLGVLDVVRNLVDEQNGIALIALHDINLAMRHCDQIVLFGENSVLSHGAPEHAMSPDMLSRAYHVKGRIETCSQGTHFVIVDGLTNKATQEPITNR
ncbi:ABC transporter ATP-binding protein [Thalassospira alkalitolerans]|uniref:ABC transporter ATP-binding protein n=1 Tax=Thalassospira alkalitolerans TaxID=1293890 RepID=UPI003AA976EB